VNSGGEQISGLGITLWPALRFSGQVTVDSGAAVMPNLTSVRVSLVPDRSSGTARAIGSALVGTVRPDGQFEIPNVVGARYAISVVPPAGWWLKSVNVEGIDVTDRLITFDAGQDRARATLVLSNQSASLSGLVLDSSQASDLNLHIVAFIVDPARWSAGSSRVRAVRVGTDARFRLTDLPGGEYYVIALTDVSPADLADSEFLQSLVSRAMKVTIADGQQRSLDLTVAR
jgi:hypothetical protein